MRSILGIVLFSLTLSTLAQSGRPEQPDIPGDINIDFGLNFLQNSPAEMDTRWWPSRSFSAHYQRLFPLSERFVFAAKLGIGNDRFSWDRALNFQLDSAQVFRFDTLTQFGIRKNLLTMSYIDAPLELRYHPLKTKDGTGFFVGVGAFIGYRFDSHTKIKFDVNDETRTYKQRARFGLSNVRYGVIGRVGWKSISVFYRQQLSNLFNEAPFDVNQQFMTFGVTLTGF